MIEQNQYLTLFHQYVKRMREIRLLSTPDLKEIKDPDEYGRILALNFSKIGELAVENRRIINDVLKPIISSDVKLTDEMREMLLKFDELLVDEDSMEEVDIHLSEIINRILNEHELLVSEEDDENARVQAMAKKVKRDYFLISALTRYDSNELEGIRRQALENRSTLAKYLDKELFVNLSAEAKGAVLQFSLMGVLLYESNIYAMPDSWWGESLSILDQAQGILKDPFYKDHLTDYDWEAYEFRIYYYGSFLAYSLIPKHVAKKVYIYADKAVEFLEKTSNDAIRAVVNVQQEKDLRYMASVLAGDIPAREACDSYYSAYESRDKEDYSLIGADKNLDTPSFYLSTAKITQLQLTEMDFDRYIEIENSVLEYIYKIPKQSSVYMKCVTLMTNFPQYFREVPGGMTMEEFCVKAFAAVHPPTYVHINMVARFSECMVRHLLNTNPQLFIGFPGCDTEDQVISKKNQILFYSYHAALCHDLGKMFIVDVISMYGRNLLDDEFSMIKSHPVTGARIASMHASTRDYVDVIKGHHRWYNCSKGYPADFDTFKSPYKTIIDIVAAADCLDAATDTVGRSYNRGKTFDDFEKEIEEGAGTRYAPFLVELFRRPEVRMDILYLLGTGRKRMYRELYKLLT